MSAEQRIAAIVRESLARHQDRDRSTIHPWQRLEEDLDLTPLELVLLALDVEEIEDVTLPLEQLATVRTVGDLLSFFARTVARDKRARRARVA
jgi:acyl carrier protein